MSGDRHELERRIEALSPQRRALLAARLGLSTEGLNRRAAGLVAFVDGQSGSDLDGPSIHEFLRQRLPDYMVPRRIHVLDRLPRTSAGKLDRAALAASGPMQAPEPPLASTEVRTESESILAEIWGDVLGVSEVSVDDDFFELGGDSLLSIRILSRARQRGLQISPEHFFAKPTIAGQAAAAGGVTGIKAEDGLVTGTAPLIPIQHWFLERIPVDPQHWNQSMLLSIREQLDDSLVERALQKVLLHHDGLRTLFRREGSGWVQHLGEPAPEPPLEIMDLSSLSSDELAAQIDAVATRIHRGFDLERGPLLAAVLFRTANTFSDKFLLVAHHLLVDAVSWRILWEDLTSICEQLHQGRPIALAPKTSSTKAWAKRLQELARADQVTRQSAWWLAQVASATCDLPVDFVSRPEENRVSTSANVWTNLSIADTSALINEVPQAYHTRILDVLLAGFAAVVTRWARQCTVQVDVERHGRQPLFEDLDVSRTVGWFTTVFPLALTWSETDDIGPGIKRTKELLRDLPDDGLGFGLLRYFSPDPQARLAMQSLPNSQVCFNYLGQRSDPGGSLTIERENPGCVRSPRGLRAYLLDVNVELVAGQLQMNWTYSQAFHRKETIDQLAADYCRRLRELIEHCRLPESGGRTPSDFPLAGLDQSELDGLSQMLEQMDGDGQAD